MIILRNVMLRRRLAEVANTLSDEALQEKKFVEMRAQPQFIR